MKSIFCSSAVLLACMAAPAAMADDVIWDFGPDTGTDGGCWSNYTGGQNFAEKVVFDADVNVTGMNIYTCIASPSGDCHVKILTDAGGVPGSVVIEWDQSANNWVADGPRYRAEIRFDPVPLDAGTYWMGVSGNGWEMGQTSVLTPGDGRMAQFSGNVYGFMTGVGDQMFQVLGGAGGGGPTLDVVGVCPGRLSFVVTGATPGGNVAYIYAFGIGSVTVPSGPCAGTVLGLNGSATLGGTATADGGGTATFSHNVPRGACGRVYVQGLDISTCSPTNVVGL